VQGPTKVSAFFHLVRLPDGRVFDDHD
jgi:hypothetical protein